MFLPSVYTIFAQKKAANGLRKINRLIAENNLEKALAYIDEWLSNHSKDDKAYYLKGLVFWKQGNWKLTIENYLKAIEINPNSPAKQAYEMVMDIINFPIPIYTIRNHGLQNQNKQGQIYQHLQTL